MQTTYLRLLKPRLFWFLLLSFSGNLAAQTCDLTITIDVGTCVAASSTLPVDVTIGDPYDEAKEIDILLDSIPFPWSPIDIDDIFIITFTCWVTPGEFHTIFTQSTDVPGCEETLTFFVPPCVCSLDVSAAVAGPCNSNQQVPVNVSVDPTNPAGNGFNLLLDGALSPGSPFTYSASGTATVVSINVQGNGSTHTIVVEDIADPGCRDSVHITTPLCASSTCSISANATVTGPCNGNQQVPVTTIITAQNHGSGGFQLLLDGVLVPGAPFNYAAGSSTSVVIDITGNGGSHTIQVYDAQQPGCAAQTTFITPNCASPPACMLSASVVVAGSCNASNQVPVTLTVMASGNGNAGFNVFLDGALVPGSPFLYSAGSSTSVNLLVNGNGALHTLQVQDAATPSCSATTNVFTPNCAIPCSLAAVAVVSGTCNANNQVPVTLTVTASGNGNAGFNVFLDGTLAPGSPFSYLAGSSTSVNLLVNGNGALHTLQAQDAAIPSCSVTTNLITPNCTLPCALTAVAAVSGSCNANNQVPVTLTVSSSGNGNSGFNVFLDGALAPGSPFLYSAGSSTSVNLFVNGNGGNHFIQAQDAQNFSCSASTQVVTPNCQSPCVLTINASVAGPCDTAGWVPVAVQVNASGNGSGGFNLFIDGSLSPGSPFSYSAGSSTTININVPGNGIAHLFQVQDAQIFNCISTTYLTTPLCQNNCAMSVEASITGSCNENGVVPVTVSLTTSGGGNGFNLFIDGALSPGSPYNYAAGSSTTVNLFLTGDGNTHLLQVQDISSPACSDAAALVTPVCSGGPCAIGPLRTAVGIPQVIEVQVNDNFYYPSEIYAVTGDTIRFLWVGMHEHTVTSDNLSGTDVFNSGLHGLGYQFDVVLTEAGNHPFYCIPHGSPGGIGMSGVIIAGNPCDDGLLPVSVSFTADGGSATGYFITLDGNAVPGNPFGYTGTGDNYQVLDVPADGNTHTINITDAANPACAAVSTVQMADCSDPCFGFNAGAAIQINHFDLIIDFDVAAPASGTSWTWNFGDGSMGEGPSVSHSYATPGTYTACLIAESGAGCFDSTCYAVTLLDVRCAAKFAWTNAGLTVSFNNQSAAAGPLTNISWTFGDGGGSQETDPVHTYTSPGIFEVCLSITADTCTDIYCTTLDLSDPCLVLNAGYTFQNAGDPLKLQFTDLTTGNPDQWLWGFGDGQTSFSQNPLHTFVVPGVYNVCLIAGNSVTGCYAPVFCKPLGVGVNAVTDQADQPLILLFPNPLNRDMSECFVSGLPAALWGKPLQIFIHDAQSHSVSRVECSGAEMTRITLPPGLPAGVYFVKLMGENAVYASKLIVR